MLCFSKIRYRYLRNLVIYVATIAFFILKTWFYHYQMMLNLFAKVSVPILETLVHTRFFRWRAKLRQNSLIISFRTFLFSEGSSWTSTYLKIQYNSIDQSRMHLIYNHFRYWKLDFVFIRSWLYLFANRSFSIIPS